MQEYNGYKVVKERGFGMFTVRAVGKGALPKVLSGSFNSEKLVKQAIDRYVKLKK